MVSKLDKIEFQSHQEAPGRKLPQDADGHGARPARRSDQASPTACTTCRRCRMCGRQAPPPSPPRPSEIYAPIANRLGLNKTVPQLQDLSFELIHPMRARHRAGDQAPRAATGGTAVAHSRQRQWQDARAGIRAQVFGREKVSTRSTARWRKSAFPSQVLDIYGFRVVVKGRADLLLALGALHSLYKPGRASSRITSRSRRSQWLPVAAPTLIGPFGTPIEVQIRTEEMHHVAQEGVASHWLYRMPSRAVPICRKRPRKWLQSLLELQSGDAAIPGVPRTRQDRPVPDEVYVVYA